MAEKGERLAAQPDDATLRREYHAVLMSRKTHCQKQLKTLLKKSSDLQIELGAWATFGIFRNVLQASSAVYTTLIKRCLT